MRCRDSCGIFATRTKKLQLLLRLRASTTWQLTSVTPIGNVAPGVGVQATFTGDCPSDTSGAAKLTAMPAAFTVPVEMSPPQVIEGAFATGGGGGGGGVGAVGDALLQPALTTSADTARMDAAFFKSLTSSHNFANFINLKPIILS